LVILNSLFRISSVKKTNHNAPFMTFYNQEDFSVFRLFGSQIGWLHGVVVTHWLLYTGHGYYLDG